MVQKMNIVQMMMMSRIHVLLSLKFTLEINQIKQEMCLHLDWELNVNNELSLEIK